MRCGQQQAQSPDACMVKQFQTLEEIKIVYYDPDFNWACRAACIMHRMLSSERASCRTPNYVLSSVGEYKRALFQTPYPKKKKTLL